MTLNTGLFLVFAAVALALAGPRVVGGLRDQAPPLPTLRPVVGPITQIVDGDTFWIGQTKIRLWGIDAPEALTPNGPLATRYLAAVVADRPLTCRQSADSDHFGRRFRSHFGRAFRNDFGQAVRGPSVVTLCSVRGLGQEALAA